MFAISIQAKGLVRETSRLAGQFTTPNDANELKGIIMLGKFYANNFLLILKFSITVESAAMLF